MFSYYCDGINFSDIAHLKKENIQGDRIVLTRRKTRDTERTEDPIVIQMRQEVKDIIAEQPDNGDYLFPVLSPTLTPEEQKRKIKNWIINNNKRLAPVAVKLGIFDLDTYTARHTFATMMLRAGATIADIQKRLGHSKIETTIRYIASLDQEGQWKFTEKL